MLEDEATALGNKWQINRNESVLLVERHQVDGICQRFVQSELHISTRSLLPRPEMRVGNENSASQQMCVCIFWKQKRQAAERPLESSVSLLRAPWVHRSLTRSKTYTQILPLTLLKVSRCFHSNRVFYDDTRISL